MLVSYTLLHVFSYAVASSLVRLLGKPATMRELGVFTPCWHGNRIDLTQTASGSVFHTIHEPHSESDVSVVDPVCCMAE